MLGKHFAYVKAASKFKTIATHVKAPERFQTILEQLRIWAESIFVVSNNFSLI
jgi:isochorismate pyruvate lyase